MSITFDSNFFRSVNHYRRTFARKRSEEEKSGKGEKEIKESCCSEINVSPVGYIYLGAKIQCGASDSSYLIKKKIDEC